MPDDSSINEGQPGFVPAALFGLCPRCGARTLYAGIARFAPRCRACELDFESFNVGDGPAAFLTLIIGAVIVGLAMWVEFTFAPPLWVHALLWVPLTAASVTYGLRVSKAALAFLEWTRGAGEGRIKD